MLLYHKKIVKELEKIARIQNVWANVGLTTYFPKILIGSGCSKAN